MCDIVIIDGTPCELVTDAVILSRMVDTTIVITAHKMTKKDALQRVIKNIKNVGGNLAGVVINKVPNSSKRYGEKYYYYGSEHGKEHKIINSKVKEELLRRNDDSQYNENHNFDFTDFDNQNNIEENEINIPEYDVNNIDFETPKSLKTNQDNSFDSATYDSYSPLSKTTDILNQINEYLEKEKNS